MKTEWNLSVIKHNAFSMWINYLVAITYKMFPSLFIPNASNPSDDRTLQKLSELSGSCDDLLYKILFQFLPTQNRSKKVKKEKPFKNIGHI